MLSPTGQQTGWIVHTTTKNHSLSLIRNINVDTKVQVPKMSGTEWEPVDQVQLDSSNSHGPQPAWPVIRNEF